MDSNEGEKGKLARLILAFFILLALFILVSEFASSIVSIISVNQTTSASGCFTGCNGIGNNFDKNNIVDGKFPETTSDSGNWIADITSEAWVTVEFSGTFRISNITVYDELGDSSFFDREPAFDIWYSFDNSTWTNLSTGIDLRNGVADNYTEESPGDWASFDAQYIRLAEVTGEINEARISELTIWGEAVTLNFQVTAKDIANNVINNFTAIVNGTPYITTNGVAITTIIKNSGSVSIVIEDAINNDGLFFNKTIVSHDTSINYEATGLYQSEIKSFVATEKYTNTTLTGAFYNDTAEQNPPIFLLASPINFTFVNASHYNKTQEFNIIALQNETKNITGVYNTILNTTASNPYGGAITDFNVSIYQGILGVNETNSTTSGEILFNILYDYNYTVTFSALNLTSNTTYIYIANGTNYTSLNFITFAFNSINLNIFNGTTKNNLLTQLITISIFSNVTNEINTTTTGTLFRSFLTPVTYELRFNSTGFNPTSKFITVINDSNQNISIFMLSNVSHELQIIEVVDTANQPVESVIVWLQREVPGGGAGITYVTTQEAQTDFEGKTAVWIIKDTAIFYRFSVIQNGTALDIEPNGNTVTGKTFFIPGVTETVQLIVNLETAAAVNILEHQNIITNMTFSPPSNNNTVTFTWIDGANIISGATLKIEARYLDNVSSTFEFITQVSSDLTSGLLNFTLIPLNNTIYRLTGLLNFTGYAEVFEQKERVYTGGLKTERNLGLLYAAIVLITMALITVNFGALVSSLFTFGALIPLAMFSIISVPVTIITSLLALAFVLFIKIRKDEGG